MSIELFHPVIQQWFRGRFAAPTEPQELGWPDLVAGRDVLIAAPTGSGKTLTAFLAAIDRLLRLAVRNELTDEIRVVYVSPLRALSNDMHRNLEVPLAYGFTLVGITAVLRARPVFGLIVRLRSSSSATKKTKPLNISS